MNKLNHKKNIKILIFIIVSIYFLITIWHYFQYKNIFNQYNGKIEIEPKMDFAELISKDESKLKEIGFTENQIKGIRNIELDNLSLIKILYTLNRRFDEKNIDVLSYTKSSESMTGKQYVNFTIEPIEAIYSPQENRTYVKIHYSADIQKPMFRQNKDRFIFQNNDWIYLFGYSKLHYISADGKEKFKYIGKNFSGRTTIDFKLKNNWEDKTFYLKGLSGMMIVEAKEYSDISTYSQYNHLQLFNYKKLSENWSDFSLESDVN